MRLKLSILLLITVMASAGYVSIRFYSYVFAKDVEGEVVAIDRVTQPTAVLSGLAQVPASQMYSFAVAIQNNRGEIVTASSEDRQWAVVEKGKCVEAKYFPYPFWQLDKSGTYFGARLIKLFDCPAK